jgi:heptosyltransferase II
MSEAVLPRLERLVVRAPNWLGDAVMALPAIGAVRHAYEGAHLAVAAIPSIAPLFEEATNARQDNILVIKDRRDEARVLSAGQFDAALVLPNSFRSAAAAWRSNIRQRWGYRSHLRGWMLSKAVGRPRPARHHSIYYLELVRALGIAAADDLPRVGVTPGTAVRADALFAGRGIHGRRAIGFAPGAAYGHAKRWPPQRVADLIVRLTREQQAMCLLFGADGDRDAGREIESLLPPDVQAVNLIARTDLRLLAGAIARCLAFVSNDSGAMHLAAALGVPVTAIFGPTDERVTAPTGAATGSGHAGSAHVVLTHPVFCRPCLLRDCPIDHRCMKGITVDAVLSAVTRQLEVTA